MGWGWFALGYIANDLLKGNANSQKPQGGNAVDAGNGCILLICIVPWIVVAGFIVGVVNGTYDWLFIGKCWSAYGPYEFLDKAELVHGARYTIKGQVKGVFAAPNDTEKSRVIVYLHQKNWSGKSEYRSSDMILDGTTSIAAIVNQSQWQKEQASNPKGPIQVTGILRNGKTGENAVYVIDDAIFNRERTRLDSAVVTTISLLLFLLPAALLVRRNPTGGPADSFTEAGAGVMGCGSLCCFFGYLIIFIFTE